MVTRGPMIEGQVSGSAKRTQNIASQKQVSTMPKYGVQTATPTYQPRQPYTPPVTAVPTQPSGPSDRGGGGVVSNVVGGGIGAGGVGGVPGGGQPAAPIGIPDLGSLTAEELLAAIEQLEATLGLSVEEMSLDQSEIGQLARSLTTNLNLAVERAQEGLTADVLSRGIYDSGITVEGMGQIAEEKARGLSDIENQRGASLEGLRLAMQAIKNRLAGDRGSVLSNIERSNIDPGLRAAYMGRLNALNLDRLNQVR